MSPDAKPSLRWTTRRSKCVVPFLYLAAAFLAALVANRFLGSAASNAVEQSEHEPLLRPVAEFTLQESLLPARGIAPRPAHYKSCSIAPSDEEVQRLIQSVQWQEWFGIYLGKVKIGAARATLRKTRGNEPGAFLIAADFAMRSAGDGSTAVTLISDARFYSGAAPFSLVAFQAEERGARFLSVDARLTQRGFEITTSHTPGAERTRTSEPSRETLRFAFSSWIAGPENQRTKKPFEAFEFNRSALSDSPVEVHGAETRNVKYSGKPTKVLVTDIFRSLDDSTTRQHVTSRGQLLQEVMPGGLVLRAEPKEEALQLTTSNGKSFTAL